MAVDRRIIRASLRLKAAKAVLALVVLFVFSPGCGRHSEAAEPGTASNAMADNNSKVQNTINHELFSSYEELCGFPIVVAPTPFVSLAAEDKNGDPIIIIDPDLLRPEEYFHRMFMIAHECAHHVMGHTTADGRARRRSSGRVVRDQELSADCWAAESLAKAGLGRVPAIMAARFHRAGLYSPGAGYPAGIHRSLIVRQCAAAGYRGRFGIEEPTPPILFTPMPQ